MAQLILAWLLVWGAPAFALTVQPRAIASHPGRSVFQGTKFGGLSALAFHDGVVYLLSDDRGRNGSPRFYEASLKIEGERAVLQPRRVRSLKNVPGLDEFKTNLDPEGFARQGDGGFFLSSEANTHSRPRGKNRILRLSAEGRYLGELDLPDEVQPEPLGLQKKGTQNNAGPEGLSLTPRGDHLWVGYERALTQEKEARVVRLDRHRRDLRGGFVFEKSHRYRMSDPDFGTLEVIRGVSEVLAVDDTRLLVLERTGILSSRFTLTFGGALFLADCSGDVCRKTKVLDLDRDLKKIRGGKPVANFEGLAWGPRLADGSASLLLLSDNNFMKDDDTELIVLSVKDGP
ncbi:MAG: esterase-like activity of phytase family protein [Bdellovibrionaceae bacterium]|nr:esterase-like activity of phytase family protein [Pseudobdellovibrionaceae bacterium]